MLFKYFLINEFVKKNYENLIKLNYNLNINIFPNF